MSKENLPPELKMRLDHLVKAFIDHAMVKNSKTKKTSAVQSEVFQNRKDITETCYICWEEEDSKEMKTLECHHKFHSECLRQWVNLYRSYCPTCRTGTIKEI